MIAELERMGVEVVVLTGDNRLAADYLAKQIEVKNIRAELFPAEKVSAITDLQCQAKTVCMIGDGVNDVPALKTADVGVAMGSMGRGKSPVRPSQARPASRRMDSKDR